MTVTPRGDVAPPPLPQKRPPEIPRKTNDVPSLKTSSQAPQRSKDADIEKTFKITKKEDAVGHASPSSDPSPLRHYKPADRVSPLRDSDSHSRSRSNSLPARKMQPEEPKKACLTLPQLNEAQSTDQQQNELVILHQTGIFHNSTKGSLFLTSRALIFAASSARSILYFPLESIASVELYNFVVACIKITLQSSNEVHIFCVLTMRVFWVNSIKEMLLGNSISRDLDDRSFLIDSCLSVLAVQVAMTMTRPDRVDKLYEGEKNSKSRSFMIKNVTSKPPLNNRYHDSRRSTEDRCPCQIVTELLSTALTLFFAFTVNENSLGRSDSSISKSSSSGFARGDRSSSLKKDLLTRSASSHTRRTSNPARGPLDFDRLQSSKDFEQFSLATAEMQTVNLHELSEPERKVFLINTYNLMVLHGYFLSGFPCSLLEWRYFSRFTSYTIGGLPYRLDMIHRLLRGAPARDAVGEYRFEESEPQKHLMLKECDPRIHFVLCRHNNTSPAIRIVLTSNVELHLEAAALEYCEAQVAVSPNCVVLSMLFHWYQQDFFDTSRVNNSEAPSDNILSNLQWLAPEQKKLIANMVEQENQDNHYEIRYRYDWTPNSRPTL